MKDTTYFISVQAVINYFCILSSVSINLSTPAYMYGYILSFVLTVCVRSRDSGFERHLWLQNCVVLCASCRSESVKYRDRDLCKNHEGSVEME